MPVTKKEIKYRVGDEVVFLSSGVPTNAVVHSMEAEETETTYTVKYQLAVGQSTSGMLAQEKVFDNVDDLLDDLKSKYEA